MACSTVHHRMHAHGGRLGGEIEAFYKEGYGNAVGERADYKYRSYRTGAEARKRAVAAQVARLTATSAFWSSRGMASHPA